MNYNLNKIAAEAEKSTTGKALRKLLPFMRQERKALIFAFISIIISSGLNLAGPVLIGHTIDTYIQNKEYSGVLLFSGILLTMYLVSLVANYAQARLMGGVGQRMLYSLRNTVFNKLQELPAAFFNQNKAGDLISRINNDTDKLNQFFSQSLMQFVGSIFTMVGAGIFLLAINIRLGAAGLIPALVLLAFTRIISPWVKKKNAASLKSTGDLSAEIQESLNNFKVIIAFNRRDYFRRRFNLVNKDNYKASVNAGLVNNIFLPVFTLCSNLAQLVVLAYGIHLIAAGNFTIGLLISYLAYVNTFYNPIRQLAALWTNFQVAMAGWDRISHILNLGTDMPFVESGEVAAVNAPVIEFKDVSFHYPDGKDVLHHINFRMEQGKTYALVGPTGGGKSTTASLLARLYDPTSGMVLLNGRDIRSYDATERAKKIGFILQEPFLFTGTLRENILYGNEQLAHLTNEEVEERLREAGLGRLLERFENGLETSVAAAGDSISLGQKQLIAFIRAVARNPDLLILDEATANIDTVTEQLLQDILQKLPDTTTRVIIAHRLNTIENADEIFFVNSGEITRAGSFDHALKMLLHDQRST